ncbi:MAG: GNAT family N-acetyltransferase, partial [Alphaproteobacteria bacterium]|nr:GNAT family N-acetyltransferase [Alphaproteobacteria bacterium]
MSLPPNPLPTWRELNARDAEAMASLHAASFAEPQQWTAESIRGLMLQPTTHSFALMQHDAMLGFMMASFVAGESEILTLAIHPEQRRKGYAKRLIKHFIQLHRAQKLQKIFL